ARDGHDLMRTDCTWKSNPLVSATFSSPMRPNALSMLAFLGLAVSSAYAETGGDASDVFLNAYMSFQRAEKADGAGDVNNAIKNFNLAISLLDQVSQRWPTWNPTIVKHRRDRAVESLGRLQAKGPSGQPDADPLNGAALPENGGELLPPDSFPNTGSTAK